MVDPQKLRSLVEIMTEHDLCEISYKTDEEEIVIKRPGARPAGGEYAFGPMMYTQAVPAQAPMAPPAPAAQPAGAAAPAPPAADEGLVPIKSPMVGTVYLAPDPESSPFVTEGARVSLNSVVCIVEAMKVFNEIKAGVSGTIKKVLVKNEDPVEFGQPLFLVRPD